MHPLPRAAALLASVLVVANCAATPEVTQMSRSAPEAAPASPATRASASQRDLSCLAEAVYFEARGTGIKGESAVAHVVVNRAKAPDEYPDFPPVAVTDSLTGVLSVR